MVQGWRLVLAVSWESRPAQGCHPGSPPCESLHVASWLPHIMVAGFPGGMSQQDHTEAVSPLWAHSGQSHSSTSAVVTEPLRCKRRRAQIPAYGVGRCKKSMGDGRSPCSYFGKCSLPLPNRESGNKRGTFGGTIRCPPSFFLTWCVKMALDVRVYDFIWETVRTESTPSQTYLNH